MRSVGNESLLNQCNLLCQLKDTYKRRYLLVVFLLRFYSALTDSLCCQHQLICHGEKVTAINTELFQKHLERWALGHMSGQTVYSHCFLSNLILVISNTAILQRLVSGREQTDCFLVELLSVKITVSAVCSQPTTFNVFKLLFGHCNLSAVSVGPMSIRWLPSSHGGWSGWWYYIVEAKIGFITLEHPTFKVQSGTSTRQDSAKCRFSKLAGQMLCVSWHPFLSDTYFSRSK